MFLICLDLQELGLLMEAPEKLNKDQQISSAVFFRNKKRYKALKNTLWFFMLPTYSPTSSPNMQIV